MNYDLAIKQVLSKLFISIYKMYRRETSMKINTIIAFDSKFKQENMQARAEILQI